MPFAISITETQVFTALRTFLLAVTTPNYPAIEIVRGQVNRVPEPSAGNFIVMWTVRNTRLSTNVDSYADVASPTELDAMRPSQIAIQLDIHGPDSSDIAQIITTIWRSEYGVEAIPVALFAPLYAVDPRQLPFVNGENQYEYRWVVELQLQTNPVVSTPMEFADKLSATVMPPVDGA